MKETRKEIMNIISPYMDKSLEWWCYFEDEKTVLREDCKHNTQTLPLTKEYKLTKEEDEFDKVFDEMLAFINIQTGVNERERIKSYIAKIKTKAKEEERQFILNVLDGVDIADEQAGNKGGGTKAIRLALKSRMIWPPVAPALPNPSWW